MEPGCSRTKLDRERPVDTPARPSRAPGLRILAVILGRAADACLETTGKIILAVEPEVLGYGLDFESRRFEQEARFLHLKLHEVSHGRNSDHGLETPREMETGEP